MIRAYTIDFYPPSPRAASFIRDKLGFPHTDVAKAG